MVDDVRKDNYMLKSCVILFYAMLISAAHARTAQELADQYEKCHKTKDIQLLLALHYTNEAPPRAIAQARRAELDHLDLQITKTEVEKLSGDTVVSDAKQMFIYYDIHSQTNRSSVSVRWARFIRKFGDDWYFVVPGTGEGNTDKNWATYRSRFSDSDIAHYRKRAKEILRDPASWKRVGAKYEGPYDADFDDVHYACDPAGRDAPKIVVIVPLKNLSSHNRVTAEITFQQHMKELPDEELVRIEIMYAM